VKKAVRGFQEENWRNICIAIIRDRTQMRRDFRKRMRVRVSILKIIRWENKNCRVEMIRKGTEVNVSKTKLGRNAWGTMKNVWGEGAPCLIENSRVLKDKRVRN